MSRQWKIKFRHEQQQCCPKATYYRVEEVIMMAESEEQAKKKVIDAWSWDGKVEIKSITELIDN